MPVDRGICCHVGGNIDFDGEGNLYLSTGDDTNPFQSDGYAPLDDAPEPQPGVRRAAQRGQHERPARQDPAHPRPSDGGGYTIPQGNLFPHGHGEDPAGDLRDGPAQPVPLRGQPQERRRLRRRLLAGRAGRPNPQRGPAGHGRWMVIRKPANYGWPYCATPDLPYVDYDFADQAVRRGVQLQRRRSTTRRTTPACASCRRSRSRTSGTRTTRRRMFPELGQARGGIGPMGGPAYAVRRQATSSPFRWPERTTTAPAVLRVDARLHQGLPPQRHGAARRDRGRRRPTS